MSDPDLDILYEATVISPRLAARLWLGGQPIAETYRRDLGALRDELPPIAQRHGDATGWRAVADRFRSDHTPARDRCRDLERLAHLQRR